MLTLSVAARNLLKQNTVQLVETLEFSFRGESDPSMYFCNFPEPIQWPAPTGNVYQPLGYKRDTIRQSIQTGYEPVRIQVVNVNQQFLEILARREVYGARVTIRRLFRELLDDADASMIIYRGVVAAPLLDESSFTFNLVSILASYNVDVPKRVFAPQCFVGNTGVLLPNGNSVPIRELEKGSVIATHFGSSQKVRAKMVRNHFGDLVTISTGCGQVTGTPNHPALTEHGWVPLGKVLVGQNLIKNHPQVPESLGSDVSVVDPNNGESSPTEFGVAALVASLARPAFVTSAVNLQHNAGPDEKISVENSDGGLGTEWNPTASEPALDSRFKYVGIPKSALLAGLRLLLPGFCGLSSRDELFELVARLPNLDPEFATCSPDSVWVDPEHLSDVSRRSRTSNVLRDKKFLGVLATCSTNFDDGWIELLQIPEIPESHDGPVVHPGDLADLGDGLALVAVDPSKKFLDIAHALLSSLSGQTARVENVSWVQSVSVPVYDIETDSGYFVVVGDSTNPSQSVHPAWGFIVHNCQWRFGDNFCGVDLESPENNHFGEVMASETSEYYFDDNTVPENPMIGVDISGTDLERLSGNSYWKGGFVTFLSGKNAGISRSVQRIRFFRRPDPGSEYEFTKDTHHTRINLFSQLPYAPEPGDKYRLRRGCMKTFTDCGIRYDNRNNFGGFPTMPRSLKIEAD